MPLNVCTNKTLTWSANTNSLRDNFPLTENQLCVTESLVLTELDLCHYQFDCCNQMKKNNDTVQLKLLIEC